jgi:hypothetical protein
MSKTNEQIVTCADLKNQSAVKAFYELVKSYSYKDKEKSYNTDFVFFVGASFAKNALENIKKEVQEQ